MRNTKIFIGSKTELNIGKLILSTLSLPSLVKSFTFGDDDVEFGIHGILLNDNGEESYDTSSSLFLWLCGYIFVSCYVALHRKTFELWYLPEHHPPSSTRSKYDNINERFQKMINQLFKSYKVDFF